MTFDSRQNASYDWRVSRLLHVRGPDRFWPPLFLGTPMTPAYFFLQWICSQLDRAYKRLAWKYEIAKAEDWKRKCEICYLQLSATQRKAADAEAFWRRHFGGRRHKGIRVHNENKHGGPPGYRVCSESQWDNAVRALDEDR